jgi:hypothetical protein
MAMRRKAATATVVKTVHRCKSCGAKINTVDCVACEIEFKKRESKRERKKN